MNKINALVIRETNFGDADRYITVLTETGRKLEILCRAIRRKGSRTANACRLFCWSEMTVYENHGKFALGEAAVLSSFWGITQDIESYALACYFAELAAAMTDTDEDMPVVTRIFLLALHALTEQKRPPALVKAAFEMRLMGESGFAPRLSPCVACDEPISDAPVFVSVRAGTALCAKCAQRLGTDGVPLSLGALAALQHMLNCDLKKLYAFSLGGDSLALLSRFAEDYALFYAERGFDSLTFYHSL